MLVSLQRVKWYIWFLVSYVVRNPLKKREKTLPLFGKHVIKKLSYAQVWLLFREVFFPNATLTDQSSFKKLIWGMSRYHKQFLVNKMMYSNQPRWHAFVNELSVLFSYSPTLPRTGGIVVMDVSFFSFFFFFKVKDQQEAEKKKVTSMDIQATIEVYIELLSPLNPYIIMHILPTVHCTFPMVLTRRNRLTITRFLGLRSFSLFSWP